MVALGVVVGCSGDITQPSRLHPGKAFHDYCVVGSDTQTCQPPPVCPSGWHLNTTDPLNYFCEADVPPDTVTSGGGGSTDPNPDPTGSCNDEAADEVANPTAYSGKETNCGAPDVIFVVNAVLAQCPTTAIFIVYGVAEQAAIHYELQRSPTGIRSKSFGGVLRFDVANYSGTRIGPNGIEQIRGDVWCQAGAGIFSGNTQ